MEKKSGIDFNSIRTRITLILLLAGALIISATAFFGFKIFEKTLVAEIGSNRSDVLSQIGDRVRQVKNSTYMVSNLYYYDERLRLQMEELAAGGENEEALTSYMDGLTGQYKQSLYSGEMDYDVHLVLDNGWSYALSFSTRQGGNSYVDGVYYNTYAYFGSVEKLLGYRQNHRLGLTVMAAPSERSAPSPAKQPSR